MLFSENQPLSTFCNAQEGSECSWIPKSLPDKHFDQSEEVRWGLNRQFVHLRQQRKWVENVHWQDLNFIKEGATSHIESITEQIITLSGWCVELNASVIN